MNEVCNICGQKFKSLFALNGHKKMKDDIAHRAWREKNIDSNDRPEIQKSAVQPGMYSPEVLEKAKELIEKGRRDEIINKYYKNAIQPMFDNGSWLDNKNHQSIMAKKDEDHKLEKSAITASYQHEKKTLEHQIEYQGIEIKNINEENFRLNSYIDNTLYNEVGRGREALNHDIEDFNAITMDFHRYQKAELSKLDKKNDETERKKKIVEMRENSVAEREESLKKQKEDFAKYKERVDNALEEKINNLNNREHDVMELEKRFLRLTNETEKELDLERKSIKDFNDNCEREIKNKEAKLVDEKKDDEDKIKKEWEKINKIKKEQKAERQRLQKRGIRLMTNSIFNMFSSPDTSYAAPKLLDGTDHAANQINQSKVGNDIHPEDNKNDKHRVFTVLSPAPSSGEPLIKSGFSPTVISGDEVKAIESSDEPVMQSGYSTCYFGAGNFNRKAPSGQIDNV